MPPLAQVLGKLGLPTDHGYMSFATAELGAELIGSESVEAAAEVVAMAIEALQAAGATGVSIDFTLPDLVERLARTNESLAVRVQTSADHGSAHDDATREDLQRATGAPLRFADPCGVHA